MLSFVFKLLPSSLFRGKERCSVVVLRYGHAHKESVKSEYDGLLYLTVRE